MQAITVKFLDPTDTKPARYKASCEAGSLTLSTDYGLDPDRNALRVAHALASKLEWTGRYHQGGTKDGWVFVCEGAAGFEIARKEVSESTRRAVANISGKDDPRASR